MGVGYDADIAGRGHVTTDVRTDGTTDVTLEGRLLLVVGARRSGTHWVQRILEQHPAVTAVPNETYLFSRGVAPLLERLHHAVRGTPSVGRAYAEPDLVERHVRPLCDDVLGGYLETDLSGAELLLERTPEHVHHIDLVRRLYPGTRFVHVVRDGFEVVRSLLQQPWGPSEAGTAAAEWRDAVIAGRGASEVPGYVEVRYEELDAEPRAGIGRLLQGLGLDAGDEILGACLHEAGVVANTRGRGRGAGGLDRAAEAAVRRVAGDLLADLGYLHGRGGGSLDRLEEAAAALRSRFGPAEDGGEGADDGGPPDGDGREGAVHEAQRVVDRFLEEIRLGDPPTADDLVTAGVELRLVGEGRARTWRGAGAVTEFSHAVRDAGVLVGRQSFGDVHPGRVLTTVVTSAATSGGQVDATIVLRLDGAEIRSVVVYRHPLAATPDDDPPA